MSRDDLLEVRDLNVHFKISDSVIPGRAKHVRAVDGININIKKGETLGLVGESGCGKSTAGRAMLGLLKESKGTINYSGQNILAMSKKNLKKLRMEIQMIFQDPFASLNPRLKVGDALDEVLVVHRLGNKNDRRNRVKELIKLVGLNESHLSRYPHEFSGGQRQRIVIARALAINPKFIVCDEIVSALDVSIQSQILNLLEDLQKELDLTLLFIGHDLSVVRHISDRIAVMYLGRVVEVADGDTLFKNPRHPYTNALLSAVLPPDPEAINEAIILEGDVPSPINPPSGCRFHTRCPYATDKCKVEDPVTREVGSEHLLACHYDINF